MDEKDRKRFFDKVVVDPKTGCWNWTAYRTWDGYGRFRLDGKLHVAHRVAYELLRREIPEGRELDHTCRNRGCVRPDHLEAVTHQENMRRGVSANRAKTHCPKGHPLSEDNIYVHKKGSRECKTCKLERDRRRCRAKKKSADLANEADALPTTKKGTQR